MQYQSRMCVGGMLAADQATLTDAVRAEIQGFFEDNEAWLAGVLASGRERRVFRYGGSAQEQARLLFAALEGALLIARACGDPERLRASAQRLLAELENM